MALGLSYNPEKSDTDQCDICGRWFLIRDLKIIQGKAVCSVCEDKE